VEDLRKQQWSGLEAAAAAAPSEPGPSSEVPWVACDACGKWRALAAGTEVAEGRWVCAENPDPRFASCDVEEEAASDAAASASAPWTEPCPELGEGWKKEGKPRSKSCWGKVVSAATADHGLTEDQVQAMYDVFGTLKAKGNEAGGRLLTQTLAGGWVATYKPRLSRGKGASGDVYVTCSGHPILRSKQDVLRRFATPAPAPAGEAPAAAAGEWGEEKITYVSADGKRYQTFEAAQEFAQKERERKQEKEAVAALKEQKERERQEAKVSKAEAARRDAEATARLDERLWAGAYKAGWRHEPAPKGGGAASGALISPSNKRCSNRTEAMLVFYGQALSGLATHSIA
jgi:hypothetical protein